MRGTAAMSGDFPFFEWGDRAQMITGILNEVEREKRSLEDLIIRLGKIAWKNYSDL